MKKSFEKFLKLDIKPVFQFSVSDSKKQNLSDPTTTTILTTSLFNNSSVK